MMEQGIRYLLFHDDDSHTMMTKHHGGAFRCFWSKDRSAMWDVFMFSYSTYRYVTGHNIYVHTYFRTRRTAVIFLVGRHGSLSGARALHTDYIQK